MDWCISIAFYSVWSLLPCYSPNLCVCGLVKLHSVGSVHPLALTWMWRGPDGVGVPLACCACRSYCGELHLWCIQILQRRLCIYRAYHLVPHWCYRFFASCSFISLHVFNPRMFGTSCLITSKLTIVYFSLYSRYTRLAACFHFVSCKSN